MTERRTEIAVGYPDPSTSLVCDPESPAPSTLYNPSSTIYHPLPTTLRFCGEGGGASATNSSAPMSVAPMGRASPSNRVRAPARGDAILLSAAVAVLFKCRLPLDGSDQHPSRRRRHVAHDRSARAIPRSDLTVQEVVGDRDPGRPAEAVFDRIRISARTSAPYCGAPVFPPSPLPGWPHRHRPLARDR